MKLLWYFTSIMTVILILFLDDRSDNTSNTDFNSIFINSTNTNNNKLRQLILFMVIIFFILTIINVIYI